MDKNTCGEIVFRKPLHSWHWNRNFEFNETLECKFNISYSINKIT